MFAFIDKREHFFVYSGLISVFSTQPLLKEYYLIKLKLLKLMVLMEVGMKKIHIAIIIGIRILKLILIQTL